jgi:hypothetical protein
VIAEGRDLAPVPEQSARSNTKNLAKVKLLLATFLATFGLFCMSMTVTARAEVACLPSLETS